MNIDDEIFKKFLEISLFFILIKLIRYEIIILINFVFL